MHINGISHGMLRERSSILYGEHVVVRLRFLPGMW